MGVEELHVCALCECMCVSVRLGGTALCAPGTTGCIWKFAPCGHTSGCPDRSCVHTVRACLGVYAHACASLCTHTQKAPPRQETPGQGRGRVANSEGQEERGGLGGEEGEVTLRNHPNWAKSGPRGDF